MPTTAWVAKHAQACRWGGILCGVLDRKVEFITFVALVPLPSSILLKCFAFLLTCSSIADVLDVDEELDTALFVGDILRCLTKTLQRY